MVLRLFSLAFASACLSAASTGVLAAPASPAAPAAATGVCAALARDYDQIDKSLALVEANGVGDNSAPRATNREMENANYLSRAAMMLTLMQAHHCALPDHAPTMIRYLSPALTCATDRLKGTAEPESCKTENWQPMK